MTMEAKTGRSTMKRKLKSQNSGSRKKYKTVNSVLELPWKSVHRPQETGMDGDDGILELEEVTGVEVVYEETEGGKIARFKVQEVVVDLQDSEDEERLDRELSSHLVATSPSPGADASTPTEKFDSQNLIPEWHRFSLHAHLLESLHARGFLTPTPIQAAALPLALADRDVVGVAQTGSGKTLAFGLPILHYLLSLPQPAAQTKRRLRALILAPTRELALQVSSHINACLDVAFKADPKSLEPETSTSAGTKPPPRVSVAAIVGGMSSQKQRRILDRGVDVLVATPGRLWDLLGEDDQLALQLKTLKFLVLDEADRMIEAGHFAELENILRLTLREDKEDQIPDEEVVDAEAEEDSKANIKDRMQTFVFSATLSKDLQRNVKRRTRPKSAAKHKKHDEKPASTLDELLLRLDFRDPDPEVIDLSPAGGVVSTLKEGKIECLSADKDVYLYYFLLRYPGRSLVFLSSIDGIRRLMPLTELLNIKAFPLHSQLEQRQRLKNLDRFKTTPNSVLLATDIAARGLDIPAVDHVIHYQIPRSADSYVHRNGRTARAMSKGFSMLMCAPDERRVVKALLGSLGRDDGDIPEIGVELTLLDKLKERVQLARKIETTQHKIKKANHERKWMKETAEAMEIELGSEFESGSDEDQPSARRRKAKDNKNAALKAQLKDLLSRPLLAKGISTRYITGGSRPIVDDLLAGQSHDTLLGLEKAEAGSDLRRGANKKKNKLEAAPKAEYEEWGGISML